MSAAPPWWQTAVIYQAYPRSFLDTDGDGVGDLEGVRAKLDHLRWLGVDGVWLSPIYRSPMADFGYDVSDHCAVDPVFGDLDGFDRLPEPIRGRRRPSPGSRGPPYRSPSCQSPGERILLPRRPRC